MGVEKVADDMINSTMMMLEHVMAVAIELQKHAATQKKNQLLSSLLHLYHLVHNNFLLTETTP